MSPRESPLLQFIKDALMNEKYPNLMWIKKDEGIVFLNCPLKSKSEWDKSFEEIYNDYGKLKLRKSSDNRQRFLQAMKVCPVIKLLPNISTKEKKYYQLRECGKSDGATDEIKAILSTNEDVDMHIVQVSTSTIGSETITDGAVLMDSGNDVNVFSSPMSANNNSFNESPIPFDINEESQSDINQLLKRVGVNNVNILIPEESFLPQKLADINFASNVLANEEEIDVAIDNFFDLKEGNASQVLEQEDMVCPDVAADNLEFLINGNASSLFDDSNNLLENSVGCNETPAIANSYNLGEEELSYSLLPNDYDPEKEFIESMLPVENRIVDSSLRNLKVHLDLPEDVKMMPRPSEEYRNWKVKKVYRLDENDPFVKCIQPTKAMYMMELKLEQS